MAKSARGLLPITVAIFFLSGVSGLVYQVIWVRQFGKVFGNTVHSAALVTGVFMCGLGVGGYVVGRWADRRHAGDPTLPLRMYGRFEIAIAALGVGLALLLPRLASLSASLSSYERGPDGWYELSPGAYVARYAIAIVTLAPSTLLMGGTLTLLVRFLVVRDVAKAGLRVGLLYGLNTAGSAVGALLTDFLWVPRLGLLSTQLVAAALNLAAGLAALALARTAWARTRSVAATPRAADTDDVTPDVATPDARDAVGRRRVRWTALALGLSGFAALGMEIAWFRYLTELLGALRSVLSMLLAVILVGIWLGSMVGGWIERRFGRPLALLLVAQGLFVLVSLALLGQLDHAAQFRRALSDARTTIAATPAGERTWIELAMNLRAIAVIVLGPSLLLGASFPLANAHVQRTTTEVGGRAGLLYLANTIGNVLGATLVGFVLLPQLGIQVTMAVLASAATLGLVPLYASATSTRETRAAAAVALTAAVVGLAAFLDLPSDRLRAPSMPPAVEGRRILSVTEGLDETIVVTEIPGLERRLWTNGHSMSGTHPKARRYMTAFAHVPLLQQDAPKRALVICFGVGSTSHAVSLHPTIETLEISDLSRHVLEQADFFEKTNGGVLRDPRTQVFIDDGRHHLAMQADATYDLVTLEPPPIAFAGVSSLYSREFYALARSRLKPGGYLTQWLPAYQVPAETTLSMIRAFIEVFPASVLLSGEDNELILMGVEGTELTMDPEAIERRIAARPGVLRDLERNDLDTPLELAGMFAASAETLRSATLGVSPLTDDHPTLEYTQSSWMRDTRMPPAIFDVSGIDRYCPGCRQSVPGLEAYLHVRGLLYGSEAFLRSGTSLPGAPTSFEIPQDEQTNAVIAASPYLRRLFEGEGYLVLELGREDLQDGYLDDALAALGRAAAMRPGDADAAELHAAALAQVGALDAAKIELERATAIAPMRASAWFSLADVARARGDAEGAARALRTGLDVDGSDPDHWVDYASVLQKLGQADAAEDAFRTALEVEPENPRCNLILCKRAAARDDLAEAARTCAIAKRGGAELPPALESMLATPAASPR